MSNARLTSYINENQQTIDRQHRRAQSYLRSRKVNPWDAEDAVQEAYLAMLEKPAHEETFEREGSVSQRRINKLSSHELRDLLAHNGTDASGRAMGALTRREMDQQRALNSGIAMEDLPDNLRVNSAVYRSAPNAGEAYLDGDVQDAADERELVFVDPSQSTPDQLAEAQLMVQRMEQAIRDEYAHDERKMDYQLRNFELQLQGYGRNEIAEIMGISPNTQKNRLTEVRKVLRRVYDASPALNVTSMPAQCYVQAPGKKVVG